MIFQSTQRRVIQFSVMVGVLCPAAFPQNTIPPTDPVKAYSMIGLAAGETLRLNVVNIGGSNGLPPGPCNVQMGFVDAAGALLKTSNVTVQPASAGFLTLTFAEASAAVNGATLRARLNLRPVLSTLPPDPCRAISSAEVFDALLGRTHLYAVPAEGLAPSSEPPPDPDFGIVAITVFDSLRFNVTNITGSNGVPPGPCNVQMGFVNAAGATIKTVAGTIAPGHTASMAVSYGEAAAATPSASAFARLNLRPLVSIPPGPCRVSASAELLDSVTSWTLLYIVPAVQADITAPASVAGSTTGQ